MGCYYAVVVDRYSNWPSVFRSQGDSSGSKGIISHLRQYFGKYSVPEEIASDGGPEFISEQTQKFFKDWQVHHRKSSVAFPHSISRAELAVKQVNYITQDFQLQPTRGNQDPDGSNAVSVLSPNSMLGVRKKMTNSLSSSESYVPSGPPDAGRYNRFNEKEQKEREKEAENWIPAVLKKRLDSHRKQPWTSKQVIKRETFLYEYAVYQKDRYFIDNIKDSIAGMVVRQPGFLCCANGTSAAGLPTGDAGVTLLTVPETPWLNAVNPVKKILADYLTSSNVDDNTKEEIINYTFENNEGIFKAFIHNRIFDTYKGLPTYEWNEEAKKKYLQAASKFKAASCSRNGHLITLYEHLVGCDRFFWRVNKVIKVVAEQTIREMQEEVIDNLTPVNRVHVLEDELNSLKLNKDEVN